MKVIFTREEMFSVVEKSFPKSMIPDGYEISGINDNGYLGFEIYFEKVVEKKGETESCTKSKP